MSQLYNYCDMGITQRKDFIIQYYVKSELSLDEVAKLGKTYGNKIRRDAKKFGIKLRDKSQAQSIAINAGRAEHPTKGKGHSTEAKQKISEKISEAWGQIDSKERKRRQDVGRKIWEELPDAKKEDIKRRAGDGIREASKSGSKLEKFFRDQLLKRGYEVEFHRERTLSNQKLQLDMFLPQLNVVVEIDGPSHFKPIWGEKVLVRNLKADSQKTGLVISSGLVMIRVKQTRRLSKKYQNDLLDKLLTKLSSITVTKKLKPEEMYIEVI